MKKKQDRPRNDMLESEVFEVAYHKIVIPDIFSLGWLAEQLSGYCGE